MIATVTRPSKQLKAFTRVHLEKGTKKTVSLEVSYDSLAVLTKDINWVVEPGEFEVMVGKSCREKDLLKDTFEVKS